MPSNFDTLRWREHKLELLDQRALPGKCIYVALDSAVAVAEAIRAMVVRGAPAIGCAAAYGVALEAQRLQRCTKAEFDCALQHAFDVLAASRPTAVNLFWALDRMRRTGELQLRGRGRLAASRPAGKPIDGARAHA